MLLVLSCSSSNSGTKGTGGSGTGGTGGQDGAVSPPSLFGPSCRGTGPGVSTCGSATDSCCTSMEVTGGSFFLSYDGISTNGASKSFSATVSDVSLDRYEVTVARFRAFVAAAVEGWHPAAGSGKHTELTQGGLNQGQEPGWDAAWNSELTSSAPDWTTNLSCDPTYATWSSAPGDNDDHPINCADWYEAYAFCIWDGGFLPSEAEWNYAAAAGEEQRLYPWSLPYPPGSETLGCPQATYATNWPSGACNAVGTSRVGSESPLGDGKWGHSDLAGNVFEWALDWYATYPSTCNDCANLTPAQYRVIRGGSFDGAPACLLNSLRETSTPDGRSSGIGFRCARPTKS